MFVQGNIFSNRNCQTHNVFVLLFLRSISCSQLLTRRIFSIKNVKCIAVGNFAFHSIISLLACTALKEGKIVALELNWFHILLIAKVSLKPIAFLDWPQNTCPGNSLFEFLFGQFSVYC